MPIECRYSGQTGQIICVDSEDLRIAEGFEREEDFSEYPPGSKALSSKHQ